MWYLHFVGVPTAPKGEVAPLWKPASSLIAKKHTVIGQVKPIGQRGRPALPTGVIIHDASTLLLDLPGDSISRYKEPNEKQKRANALVHSLLIPPLIYPPSSPHAFERGLPSGIP